MYRCSQRLPILLYAFLRAFVFVVAEIRVADSSPLTGIKHSLVHWHHFTNKGYNSISNGDFLGEPKRLDPPESLGKKRRGLLHRHRLGHLPSSPRFAKANTKPHPPFRRHDVDLINNALNVQYLCTEFFLHAAFGQGLDYFDPTLLSADGPTPVGGELANLGGRLTNKAAKEIGNQGIGHIRAIRRLLTNVTGVAVIPRPQIDIGKGVWAGLFADALGVTLDPPFNPYNDTRSFLLAAHLLPYTAVTSYVGDSPHLVGRGAKKLVAELLSVASAQDAILRTLLYNYRKTIMYNLTVADITDKLATYRDRLLNNTTLPSPSNISNGRTSASSNDTITTEQQEEGGQDAASNIVLVSSTTALPFKISPKQLLGLLYGTGDASLPGAFFPAGALGSIARRFLPSSPD